MEVRIGDLMFLFNSTQLGPKAPVEIWKVGGNKPGEQISEVTVAEIRSLARAFWV